MINKKKSKYSISVRANLRSIPFYIVSFLFFIPFCYSKNAIDDNSSLGWAILLFSPAILAAIILQITSIVLDIKSIIGYFKNKSKNTFEKVMICLNVLNIALTICLAECIIKILSLYFYIFFGILSISFQ